MHFRTDRARLEDPLLGLEPALNDFGSKLGRRYQRILRRFARHLHPLEGRRKSGERELPRSQLGSAHCLCCQSECFKVFLEVLSPTPHPYVSLIQLLLIGADRWTVLIAADGASISPANAQLMANRR